MLTIRFNSSGVKRISPALGTSSFVKFAGVAFINIFSPGYSFCQEIFLTKKGSERALKCTFSDLVTEVKCASSSKPMETLAAANETSIGRP